MNVKTGEVKRLDELTELEKQDSFWQRVPSHLNKQAVALKAKDEKVDLDGSSKLAKFAKNKREKPKGIISKTRFRDLRKIVKAKNNHPKHSDGLTVLEMDEFLYCQDDRVYDKE